MRLIAVAKEGDGTRESFPVPRAEFGMKRGQSANGILEINVVGLAFTDNERTLKPNEVAILEKPGL
jgi:hypothetical protein